MYSTVMNNGSEITTRSFFFLNLNFLLQRTVCFKPASENCSWIQERLVSECASNFCAKYLSCQMASVNQKQHCQL